MRTFLPFFRCFYSPFHMLIGNLSYVNVKSDQFNRIRLRLFTYSLFLRTAILFLCNLQISLKVYHKSLLKSSLINNTARMEVELW